MKYAEFRARECFNREDLVFFAYGSLVEDPPENFAARLPAPPFLMLDRVLSFKENGKQGSILAEQDIRMDAWYFQCHMPGDPVQPGCFCVEAFWQLLGFYCVWRGALGAGRALGCDGVSLNGQIRPFNRVVRYEIDVKRFFHLRDSGAGIAIGDGQVFVDDELIAHISGARAGVFVGI